MAGARLQAADRIEPEPGAEAVEQRRDAARLRFAGAAQTRLLGRQGFGGKQRQNHVLDAEPGIDLLELCGEQPGEVARIAARPRGAEADLLDPAIDAVKGEGEPARPGSLAR